MFPFCAPSRVVVAASDVTSVGRDSLTLRLLKRRWLTPDERAVNISRAAFLATHRAQLPVHFGPALLFGLNVTTILVGDFKLTYALHDAATVTGLPAATVASWLDRGVIATTKPGKGGRREFSIRDLDRLAVIGELCRLGLPTAKAVQAAAAFSDQRSFKRPKGQLNRDGLQTFLVVRDGGAKVYGVGDYNEFAAAVQQLFSDNPGAIVVNVSEVLRRVDRAINGKSAVQITPPAGRIYRNGTEESYP